MAYVKRLPTAKSYSKQELRALALNPDLDTKDSAAMASAKLYDKGKFLRALHKVCNENPALPRQELLRCKVLPASVVKLLLPEICV